MNARKQRFVDEYLVDLNATQAATRAKYSEKTAYSIGQRLLKDVEIQEAIQAAQEERAEKTGVTQAWVIEELVSLYKTGKQENTKTKCLELLGKHTGAFTEKIEIETPQSQCVTVHYVDPDGTDISEESGHTSMKDCPNPHPEYEH